MLAPIESSPEVFNQYLKLLGVDQYEFVDVYGLDEELLAFVPRPVRAVLLVFPLDSKHEAEREREHPSSNPDKEQVCWSAQTVDNMCGTMALVHSLANAKLDLGTGLASTIVNHLQSLPASKRPEYLASNKELLALHSKLAGEGQSAQGDISEVGLHYVALTLSNDLLVELDGRCGGPRVLARGVPPNADVLALPQTLEAIREYLSFGSLEFSMLALVERT